MSITNDTVTIAGNIGNDPVKNETRGGKPVINFRVATSSGYFDQRTGAWVEGNTNWYAVSAFGYLAEHAKASLRRGDPVIVSGRLRVKEWEANGKKGIDVEIVADAIGHDLNRGTSAFVRRPKAGGADQAPAPASAERGAVGEEIPDEPTAAEADAWVEAGMHLIDAPDADPDDEGAPSEEELAYT
ncbi:single-stranded DNA-binding protein [Microbacterium sp. NPDC058342]|uniref:single-stranded DNA-binding protein n=1 Tax=Microbacterium sp. NPDC058342 TaxID=3346454 RepID=UPI003653E802